MRKPAFGFSDQVQHKLGSAATEDEISDLGSRGIVLYLCSENIGAVRSPEWLSHS